MTDLYPRGRIARSSFRASQRSGLRSIAARFLVFLLVSPLFGSESVRKIYDLPAGPAERSLRSFSTQSGVEVIFASRSVDRATTNAVNGELTAREALDKMLAGTGLVAGKNDKTGALTVSRDPNAGRAASRNDRPEKDEIAEKKVELPVFEVMGSKLLNMDVRRTRDDALPYVVFNRERIEQSGATNLEEFMKRRLTMNTKQEMFSQAGNFLGTRSEINLRGLGANKTLILIDGRRTPNTVLVGTGWIQQDLNGIPLSAVERIEVLPTTASGLA